MRVVLLSLFTLFLFTRVTQHPSTSDKYVVLRLYEMSLSQTDEKAWLREEPFLRYLEGYSQVLMQKKGMRDAHWMSRV